MTRRDNTDRDELDNFVRAFEVAHARDGRAEIAEFLPPRNHPLYAVVLCELIRVDLEFGWEWGCPKSLTEYQRAFPNSGQSRRTCGRSAFEESRLRRQSEERAPPVGSRRRGRRDPRRWAEPGEEDARVNSPGGRRAAAS